MAEPSSERAPAPSSLKNADWLKRPQVVRVFQALSKNGVATRAVGGAVRNSLLGLPVTEIDFATTALPERVMALARAADLKAVPTGIEHGTVTVVADGTPFEVTTLRRDVETYGRHAKIAFTEDWEEDARRRDFTLNALYADRHGTVFDPLGGYADLVAGRVRFIGKAEDRIKEDYLRILRFFRFNAYYGKGPLEPEGVAACVRLRTGLAQLSAERIAGELRRILIAPKAARAVEALFDHGLLTDLLGGVPRMVRFERLVAVEEALGLAPDPALRLAALAVFVAEDAERLAARLKLSNAELSVLLLGANDHERAELPGEVAARRSLYEFGPCKFEAHLLLAAADEGAAPGDERWRQALRLADRWQVPEFPVRGSDITALGDVRGPEIGAALQRLEAEWIASDFTLDRAALLVRAAELIRTAPKQDR